MGQQPLLAHGPGCQAGCSDYDGTSCQQCNSDGDNNAGWAEGQCFWCGDNHKKCHAHNTWYRSCKHHKDADDC